MSYCKASSRSWVMQLLVCALAIDTSRITAMIVPSRAGLQAQLDRLASATSDARRSEEHPLQVTHAAPHVARRSISLDIQTEQTVLQGNMTVINQGLPGLMCGFVTSDIRKQASSSLRLVRRVTKRADTQICQYIATKNSIVIPETRI